MIQIAEKDVLRAKNQTNSPVSHQHVSALSPRGYQRITEMIYNKHDLLQLIYSQILVRVMQPNQPPPEGIYIPNGEEIKLAARSIASMPYDVIKRRNAFVYEDKDEKA